MNWIPLISLLGLAACATAATYHVDGRAGDDACDGGSPDQAWRTLERVNREVFRPGDSILFKAGTPYSGQLKPKGSGTAEEPIRIGRYGGGGLPRINGEGRWRSISPRTSRRSRAGGSFQATAGAIYSALPFPPTILRSSKLCRQSEPRPPFDR